MHYVYEIYHEQYPNPWYIGITDDPARRYAQHMKSTYRIRREAEDLETPPQIKIRDVVETVEEARALELKYILEEKPLFNKQGNIKNLKQRRRQELENRIYFALNEAITDKIQIEDYTYYRIGESEDTRAIDNILGLSCTIRDIVLEIYKDVEI